MCSALLCVVLYCVLLYGVECSMVSSVQCSTVCSALLCIALWCRVLYGVECSMVSSVPVLYSLVVPFQDDWFATKLYAVRARCLFVELTFFFLFSPAGLRSSAARCKDHRLATDVYVLRARCLFLQGCSRKPHFGVSPYLTYKETHTGLYHKYD